jgi:pSer/pThr/pTyr-binding forkhead associated (FHA) protein
MGDSPLGRHRSTPAELRERLAAERRGVPFLVFRDDRGSQRIVELPVEHDRVSIGRSVECDVALTWDVEASRLHAELERVGSMWSVVDDGLSSNGTFLRGARVPGRKRLQDTDVLQIGTTALVFRHPGAGSGGTTRRSDDRELAATVTEAQRRVLVALCRPFSAQMSAATPATNPEIAAELHLTVAAVKTHMRVMFRTFGIDDLPQQQKRAKLAAIALTTGLVNSRGV